MPTIILLDVSLSLSRSVTIPDSSEPYQLRHLAIHGINTFLDYMNSHCKLEFASLMTFSSECKKVVGFTRDFDSIKAVLLKLDVYDKTNLITALETIRTSVLDEWGGGLTCQLIVVTDGSVGVGPTSIKAQLEQPTQNILPFPFPCKLHIVSLYPPADSTIYHKLLELNSSDGHLWIPEGPLSFKSVQQVFQKLTETYYKPFHATLLCGHLSSNISLSPSPEVYSKANDFEWVRAEMSTTLSICGFLSLTEVASPPTFSRHLVLPIFQGKEEGKPFHKDSDLDDEVGGSEEGKQPSFCVLLHGSLKVEGMVAFCHLGGDWYGMLYSWADSKKKSNLMLSTFEPGLNSISWLGNFQHMGPKNDPEQTEELSFPLKPSEKRSYAQNCVVWIRQAGLQADIQKILRHARKLPEKTQQFYKELNRLRKACLSFGFYELLDGMAVILERECTLLPGTAHPDAALQLTHAGSLLRGPLSRDYNTPLLPLHTKFTSDD